MNETMVANEEMECITPDPVFCDGKIRPGERVYRLDEDWCHIECMPEGLLW